MKTLRMQAMVLAILALAALPALARVCPVTEQPAVNDYSVMYQGERVYFSCELAMEEFQANPAKYLGHLKHVNDDQKKLVKQTECPVSGEKVDRTVWADYSGKRVYLHCVLAKAEFLKNPESYMRKLHDSHVALEDAPVLEDRFPGASEGFRFAN